MAEAISLNGQRSAMLFNGKLDAGRQNIRLTNDLTTGYYILRLTTPDGILNEKLIIN